jgi:signal peptide peptidase SppA
MTTQLWLGSQESFDAYTAAEVRKLADPKFSAAADFSAEVMSQIYSVQQNVGVISIKGSLVDGSAGYGVFYGQTGYDDIRAALVAAVSNSDVKAILLDVSSGGGQVSGVDDTAQLIARVNKVKPVVTYTGNLMSSAALWLGASATLTVAGKTAIVGSLGVIMVHLDRSRQLADAGIKPTVIRAGTEKALATPYEPLSEKAQAGLQSQADVLYGVFLNHVASSRGVSATNGDKKFGQGRVFIGQQAVDAGLVDKLGTYEDAFTKAQALSKPKKAAGMKADVLLCPPAAASLSDNPEHIEGTTTMPQPLTDEALAAMAAGVELETETSEEAAAAPAATPAATVAPAADQAEALAALIAAHEAAIADLKTQHEAALTAVTSRLEKFVDIARNSVKTMGIHFGVKADAVASMDADQILAEHTRLADLFKTKFKVGGVAATTPEVVPKAKASAPPMFAALLKSTAK